MHVKLDSSTDGANLFLNLTKVRDQNSIENFSKLSSIIILITNSRFRKLDSIISSIMYLTEAVHTILMDELKFRVSKSLP